MSHASTAEPTQAPNGRIDLIDLGRGLALLAMFVFHFAYDLSYFGLIEVDVPIDPGWSWFARLIAGSFLTLVGISLVLATRGGLRRNAFLKRLAMVSGAALLVTLGTFFAMRDVFIFFGILHHVALASVLGLAFLRLPAIALALVAAIVFALPFLIAHPLLDQPGLAFLGFSRLPLRTADFVPVFPWFGCVLAGMALAKTALAVAENGAWARWRARSVPARLVAWAGRNSLIVYLLHQPVFIGLILLATAFTAQAPPRQDRPFLESCQRQCAANGERPAACTRFCGCTADALKREGLWGDVLADNVGESQKARIAALAQTCLRR